MNYLDLTFNMLCELEGVVLTPYQDSAGVWTIGIGCTRIDGKPVNKTTPPISMDKAKQLCLLEMDTFDRAISRYVKVPLNTNQRAALLSFTYNLGEGALSGSALLRFLNAGNYGKRGPNGDVSGAAGEFPKWNNVRINGVLTPSKGLTKRRLREQAVFLGEVSYASTGELGTVTPPVSNETALIDAVRKAWAQKQT